ncbi:MAG: hypothetical protein EBR82_34730 [Caulobacteraceae bacterium]|nr:hypothetical protein [Caulobacteraceae bacterium]
MNSHISRDVATKLATALAAHSWVSLGSTIDVQMRRKPDYGLDELGSLIVSVVPGPVTFTTETRQMELAEVTVGVVIARHVGSDADIAAAEDFEQEVVDAIRSGSVTASGLPDGADWTEIANPVPYDPEALDARNVFLGQVTVTYKIPMDRV